MLLRNTNFPPVCNASGIQGFFGEGYSYHRLWKYFGLTFENCGLVAKTTTMEERLKPEENKGNMPMKEDGITPKEWKPKCIIVKPWTGVMLNAVGLSGPGAKALLRDGRWQERKGEPFFISFMSVAKDAIARLSELREFVKLLKPYLSDFDTKIGLEMNFSCPNVGLDPLALVSEVCQALNLAAELNIPLRVKFNATTPVQTVCKICEHEACDALVMSNTIPWGKLPELIPWKKLFGSDTSPLAHLEGGGLSGWPLLPIVCDWIREARALGFTKPIWASGGIDSIKAVNKVHAAGTSGIQLGLVATLRPWRMPGIIQHGNRIFPV